MIRRITLEHWKSIEKLDLELGPLTVIVGPNGSGKSNFVDALRFVRDAVTDGLDQATAIRQGIRSICRWRPSKTANIFIGLKARSGSFELAITAAGDHPRVTHEKAVTIAGVETSLGLAGYVRTIDGSIRLDAGPATALGVDAQTLGEVQADELALPTRSSLAMRTLQDEIASFEAFSIFPNTLRSPQAPRREASLMADGGNLSSVLKALAKTRQGVRLRQEILDAMKLIMPSLENIHIHSLGGLMMPMFRVTETDGTRHDFNVSQISDGTLRALGILTALYHPDGPDAIALEEPEQTLHPGALAVLADAMKDASERRQIIVTTHSPHLVDHFDPDCIRVAEMIDGVTTIRPISPDQKQAVRDQLFSLGELMTIEGLHS